MNWWLKQKIISFLYVIQFLTKYSRIHKSLIKRINIVLVLSNKEFNKITIIKSTPAILTNYLILGLISHLISSGWKKLRIYQSLTLLIDLGTNFRTNNATLFSSITPNMAFHPLIWWFGFTDNPRTMNTFSSASKFQKCTALSATKTKDRKHYSNIGTTLRKK